MRIVPLSEKVEILVAIAKASRHISQNDLAEQAGLSSGQISKYKGSQAQDMGLGTAKSLARAAGIPAYYLLADDPGSYVRVWLREMRGEERSEFRASDWKGRLRLIWNHIQLMYPGAMTAEALAAELETSPASILTTVDGTKPIQPPALDEFLQKIGVSRMDLIQIPAMTDLGELELLLAYANDMQRLLNVSPKTLIQILGEHPELITEKLKASLI